MTTNPMADRPASRTAVLVAQARAVADGRILPGRFADPVAIRLLDDAERDGVERARSGMPPERWRERISYEFLQATAEHMAVRTVVIDDALRDAGASQVVILGAGLDARAWRLEPLAGSTVYEVDHPASQADKLRRVGALEPLAKLRPVAVDLAAAPLAPALEAAGFDPSVPTTWIWEGVVMYLTPEAVEQTVAQVATLSSPGSRLLLNYSTPSLTTRFIRSGLGLLGRRARAVNPFAEEPNRSAWSPASMRRLLARQGFAVDADESLADSARRFHLETAHPMRLRTFRIAVARRRAGAEPVPGRT